MRWTKHHLAHAHASWLEHRAAAQHLLKAFRRAIVLPCRYCKQSRVNKHRHYFQCPVLSTCACLQAWYESLHPGADGSRLGGSQIFRSCQRPGVLTAAHQAASTRQGGLFDTSDDQGKRQREERERAKANRPPLHRPGATPMEWDHPWPTQAASQPHRYHIGETGYYHQHMQNLTRLVLQQEQTIASLRQDVTLYLFVKTGQGSIVSLLHQTAEKWRMEKENSPSTLTYSLKIAMFKQLMIELHGRLTTVAKTPAELEKAKQLNWVDERGHWRVLKWNPLQKELQVDESKPTVPTEDLLKQTVELRKGISEEAIHRFRNFGATRE